MLMLRDCACCVLCQKPVAAPAKPTGAKAAAKSRLAAVKAAMKAKQQAAEKAAEDDANPNNQEPQPQAVSQPADSVVFDGGFFQVESPAKSSGQSLITTRQRPFIYQCLLVYLFLLLDL